MVDFSDMLGTVVSHLQPRSLSRKEWHERTSLPSHTDKPRVPPELRRTGRGTVRCYKNAPVSFISPLMTAQQKNKSGTTCLDMITCSNLALEKYRVYVRTSQGKEGGSRYKKNSHHRAPSPFQGLVSQICKGQSRPASVRVPDEREKRSEGLFVSEGQSKQCHL